MNKLCKVIFIILLTVFTHYVASAQTSIIKEMSDEYLDKLVNTALANYPRVKTMANRVAIAKEGVNRAKLSYFDSFTLSYVYQPNNTLNVYPVDNTGTTTTNRQSLFNGVQFGIFFNLGSFLQKPVAVRQAKEDLKIANNDQEEYRITLTTQIRKRYYAYVQRLAALKLQSAQLTDTESMLKDTRYRFEKGEETLDNFNKARMSFTQQSDSKIVAETNLFSAKADLEELLGDKLENIK